MREKFVKILLIVLVCSIFIVGCADINGKKNNEYEEIRKKAELPIQEGEPSEEIKDWAEKIGVEARVVALTNTTIPCMNFKYTVNSWKKSKNYPGYQVPDGMELTQRTGAQFDEQGNIVNDFSYVTIEVSKENISESDTESYWNDFNLRMIRQASSDIYTGEVAYLGEEEPREDSRAYFLEQFKKDEKKDMVLIYIVADKFLDNEGMYIEIDPFGCTYTGKKDEIDPRRYIILK